jgi:DNA helicase-2/ATP-dependent DNA helicase PcrA
VLYRLNAQSRLLQEAFERSGIPYQIVGQTPFYAEKSVRTLLDLLRLYYNPCSTLHWERTLALDRRPPTPSALAQIAELASTGSLSWSQRMAQAIYADGLIPAQRERLLALGKLYQVWDEDAPQPVAVLIERAQRFGVEQKGAGPSKEDLHRLIERAMPFGERLGDFLVATALQGEADAYDRRADRVTLTTIHAAKGLEFPTVFVVGCEDGLLPYLPENKRVDLAEERRLFYVAMTRAGRRLILAHARRRFFFGRWLENPRSRFVDDIAQALIQVRTAQARAQSQRAENVQLSLFD